MTSSTETRMFNTDFFSVTGGTSANSVNGAGQYDQIKFTIDGPENLLLIDGGLKVSNVYQYYGENYALAKANYDLTVSDPSNYSIWNKEDISQALQAAESERSWVNIDGTGWNNLGPEGEGNIWPYWMSEGSYNGNQTPTEKYEWDGNRPLRIDLEYEASIGPSNPATLNDSYYYDGSISYGGTNTFSNTPYSTDNPFEENKDNFSLADVFQNSSYSEFIESVTGSTSSDSVNGEGQFDQIKFVINNASQNPLIAGGTLSTSNVYQYYSDFNSSTSNDETNWVNIDGTGWSNLGPEGEGNIWPYWMSEGSYNGNQTPTEKYEWDGDRPLKITLDYELSDGSNLVDDYYFDGKNFTNTPYEPSVSLDQRHTDFSGGDFLQLGYALKGNDDTGNPGGDAQALGVDDSGLTNVAVLGPNTSDNRTYTLEISAESLKDGWDLESADIVLKYDTKLFETIDFDDIQIGGDLPISNAVDIDDVNGLIRIAAASLGSLDSGNSIDNEAIFASIKVDFDESYFRHSERTPDANGKFTFKDNPLGFELSANSDETVFSRTFASDIDGSENVDGSFTNREIQSLGDLNGNTKFDEGDVNLYQAEIKFEEQTGGLTFGTDRVIGANQGFTNLIRRNDTVTAETTIENIGNSLAKDIVIDDAGQVENANFIASRFLKKFSVDDEQSITAEEKVNLSGGVFRDDFSYNADGQESLNIEVDMKVTGQAGSVVDVTKGLFKVSAEGMTQNPETDATPDFFVSQSGSKNLITFQGDLNYDGRVSMKDLAFLNAGAARQQLVDGTDGNGNPQVASDASYARDVDADFSGKIDLADLSILDQDWGQSLHDGTSGGFTGSSETFNMEQLDTQGAETWDNASFKNQNAIEAEDAYIGSLEGPGTSGVVGSEGIENGSNSLEGEYFQDIT